MDFTLKKYKELLITLKNENYNFQRFDEFLSKPNKKAVILRHDVDLLPKNSLRFAKIQHELDIVGTYYFRAVPESWDEAIIREIASLGHEIGYHYENLTTCNGDLEQAIFDFENNLTNLRKLAPVTTICMHGSPMSKYDSKDIWNTFNYSNYKVIGTPYFNVDFNNVFYLTDTGRRWDGQNVSVRDKVETRFKNRYHSTEQIILALQNKELPNQIMFTFHPQRWHNNKILWVKELLMQNLKNLVKKYLFIKN